MLTYEQSTGRLYDAHGARLGIGYAGGDRGNVPQGVNNPAMQNIPNVGPLPCGIYTIEAPIDHPECGKYFLRLIPSAANQMFGRGGFGMHGDLVSAPGKQEASDGCPIQELATRIAVWTGGDHTLEVVATLPAPVSDVDGEIAA
jgi:hypothetical protein